MSAMLNSRTELPGGGHAVVVGTGVVGLSAALGCAQRGLAVTLVGPVPAVAAAIRTPAAEPAGEAPWDARIYALSPATITFLEQQRAWPQVDVARVCAVERMQVHGDDGGRLDFDPPSTGAQRLATICEESQLARALWLGCTLTPGIAHRARAFDVAGFRPDAVSSSRVQVRLDDGAVIDADLLIGADGRQSAVRAAAGIGAHLGDYGQTAVVANFTTQWPHGFVARQWFMEEGVLALLPLPGNRVSLVWSAPHDLVPALLGLSAQDFALRVARRAGHVLGAMALVGERHSFVLHRVVVERLVRSGVVLLGDAAHVVHPLAGQGLNLGLQDVSEFLRLLDAREPWRALGDAVWLRRYARARAEPIALMRATVDGIARLFGAPDDRLRRLRNIGMSAVDALAPVKQVLVRHAMG
jgi:ubiquinone biosynthesis UbiH/UbiF/VisC/COQ6 family hydroxylase